MAQFERRDPADKARSTQSPLSGHAASGMAQDSDAGLVESERQRLLEQVRLRLWRRCENQGLQWPFGWANSERNPR